MRRKNPRLRWYVAVTAALTIARIAVLGYLNHRLVAPDRITVAVQRLEWLLYPEAFLVGNTPLAFAGLYGPFVYYAMFLALFAVGSALIASPILLFTRSAVRRKGLNDAKLGADENR